MHTFKRTLLALVCVIALGAVTLQAQSPTDGGNGRPPERIHPRDARPAPVTSPDGGLLPLPPAPDGDVAPRGVRTTPTNDTFANAIDLGTLTTPIITTVSNMELAQQALEAEEVVEEACGVDRLLYSLWYRFTLSGASTVNIETVGSFPDTVLTVYTGTELDNLNMVLCNNDLSGYEAGVIGQALAAGTYYVRVAYVPFAEIPGPADNLDPNTYMELSIYNTPAAGNFTVNTVNDTVPVSRFDGACVDANAQCSLRTAIIQANFALPGSVITVPAGTYVRTQTGGGFEEYNGYARDLNIFQSMDIIGAGSSSTLINAAGLGGGFEVAFGAQVNMSGFTVYNGITTQDGGGVRVTGAGTVATLDDMYIHSNAAEYGGGISVRTGATLTLTNSTVFNNTATYGTGGGVDSFNNGWTILRNVTISGNIAAQFGGGVGSLGGLIGTIGGEDVFDNTPSRTRMNNVTVANNFALREGGGLAKNTASEWHLYNSLIGENDANVSGRDCSGTYLTNGRNVIGRGGGCSFTPVDGAVGSDRITRPIGILPLATNLPGSVPTHRLELESPALDRGAIAGNPVLCEAADARGVARTHGTACDAGAFELVQTAPTAFELLTPVSGSEFLPVDDRANFTFTWTPSSGQFLYRLTVTRLATDLLPSAVIEDVLIADPDICDAVECAYTLDLSGYGDADYTWRVEALNDLSVSGQGSPSAFAFIPVPMINLLPNGGFEDGRNNASRPAVWDMKTLTNDTRICNKPDKDKYFSYTGDCAFRFKGSPTEDARLIQVIRAADFIAPINETVTLSAYVKAKGQTRGILKMVVRYVNDSSVPRGKVKIDIVPNGFEYARVGGTVDVVPGQPIDRIKLVIRNRSLSKQWLIDNVRISTPQIID